MDPNFSKEEMKMISALGFTPLLEVLREDGSGNFVYDIYQIMVNKVFINNTQGPAVEALRRCYSAISNCTVERGSKAFNKLAAF